MSELTIADNRHKLKWTREKNINYQLGASDRSNNDNKRCPRTSVHMSIFVVVMYIFKRNHSDGTFSGSESDDVK